MAEPLNVIALISGGKDSFYSILHCIQNGHKVVALGNLYPPSPLKRSQSERPIENREAEEEEEQDLNSFMYQTVGHTVIPLYEAALGIPLYRQQILGSTIHTEISYSHAVDPVAGTLCPETELRDQTEDETESLMPLLKSIMAKHPDANGLSTGAILSTYQRSRVESVALRLGLTPLSYLWQYPTLPPGTQTSLLTDMQNVGLDARIVKVASGGLDESFLWENIASESGIRRVETSMKRFGMEGDGGVLGEGGEFETLVVDGPVSLFKKEIKIQKGDMKIVREGGGSAWLRILGAKVVAKPPETAEEGCRVPDILEQRFKDILDSLKNDRDTNETANSTYQSPLSTYFSNLALLDTGSSDLPTLIEGRDNALYWTVTGRRTDPEHTIIDEASEAIIKIRQLLRQLSLDPSSIVATTIILRSMQDFASVNSIYGTLFTAPNPPSRVTISCGSLLPKDINILVHLKVSTSPLLPTPWKALHVQSRSYWAPANIGPYSQASSILISSSDDTLANISAVSIAGQIPLIPSTMILPPPSSSDSLLEAFKFQTVLSLQHLFRIGSAMSMSWFTGAVAYVPASTASPTSASLSPSLRARIAGQAWKLTHAIPPDDSCSQSSSDYDPWEAKHYAGLERMGQPTAIAVLPDWQTVKLEEDDGMGFDSPSFWVAEVEELPRGAGIEWAALPGVVGSDVTIRCKRKEEGGSWAVERSRFGDVVQTIVTVFHSDESAEIARRIEEALKSESIQSGARACASWLDVSVTGVERVMDTGRIGGVVPCKSLWDAQGIRLAVVLVFESDRRKASSLVGDV